MQGCYGVGLRHLAGRAPTSTRSRRHQMLLTRTCARAARIRSSARAMATASFSCERGWVVQVLDRLTSRGAQGAGSRARAGLSRAWPHLVGHRILGACVGVHGDQQPAEGGPLHAWPGRQITRWTEFDQRFSRAADRSRVYSTPAKAYGRSSLVRSNPITCSCASSCRRCLLRCTLAARLPPLLLLCCARLKGL